MLDIYADSNRTSPVSDYKLVENDVYYIDLTDCNDAEFAKIISESGLGDAISWIPGNRTAELKITNYIGTITLAERRYDVRSKKFLRDKAGSEQIAALADEIEGINAGVTVAVDSPTIARRALDWGNPSGSDLHQFNYFYQLFFNSSGGGSPLQLFESVKSHAHFEYTTTSRKDFIWNIGRTDERFLRQFLTSRSETIDLSNNSGIAKSVSGALTCRTTGRVTVPLQIQNTKQVLSYDTVENRFIKYLFQNLEALCRRVSEAYQKSSLICFRAERMLPVIRQCLSDPFFAEVGEASALPTHSTVLKYRHGYKELFEHYLKSMLSAVPSFEDIADGLTMELKDIATIYEIWCYYIVAAEVLGDEMLLEESKVTMVDGELLWETTLANDEFAVSYNKSFSRKKNENYSVNLRPDVSVIHKSTGRVFLFDAKYKVKFVVDENDQIKSTKYQSNDVHKMHTYVDAIAACDSAVVLYVGEMFRFFQRDNFLNVHTDVASISTLEGVGVIPLVPDADNQDFKAYVRKLVQQS